MPRRKAAQAPRRFTGRHHTLGSGPADEAEASRIAAAPPSTPDSPAAGTTRDAADAPPPKRRRVQPPPDQQPRLLPLYDSQPDAPSRPLATLRLRPAAGGAAAAARTLCIRFGGGGCADSHAGSVWLRDSDSEQGAASSDAQAVLCAPDEAAAMALASLLRSGHICAVYRSAANAAAAEAPAAAAAAAEAAAGQPAGSSKEAAGARHSPRQQRHWQQPEPAAAAAGAAAPVGDPKARHPPPGSITLCLTAAAFAEPVSADDAAQRAWNRQLTALLPWLLPGHCAEAMPPDAEPPLLPPSPQCNGFSSSFGGGGSVGGGGDGTTAAKGSQNADSPPQSPRSPLARHKAEEKAAERVEREAAEVYAAVRPDGREPAWGADIPELRPRLRPYQSRALHWMVHRERSAQVKQEGSNSQQLHPLWRQVPTESGPFYLQPVFGLVSLRRFPPPPPTSGGILADEMGLGKTVELLALVSANRFRGSCQEPAAPGIERLERVDCVCGATSEADYAGLWLQCDACAAWQHAACLGLSEAPAGGFVCNSCCRRRAQAQVTADCGATLIVCPTPILQQWQEEIAKHLHEDSMRIITYEGQAQREAGRTAAVVTAAELAAADMVLTTYDVLRRDVHQQPSPDDLKEYGMRRRKKYEVVPTPLTRLRWWRVCLDEAQMVESSTAKAAEMAGRLSAVHRWAVSGTPISRGLEDLYGLLAFLRAAPWDARRHWKHAIQDPCMRGDAAAWARLVAVLRPASGGLMWRSSKEDVASELGLPPQADRLTPLQLSAVERHFYNRQHQECEAGARSLLPASALAASAAGEAAATADRRLTRREEAKLLAPLLRLRQACCHPQVGGGGIKALASSRSPLSMDEILDNLLVRARLEAEDAQRVLLGALNGLAGLMLLDGKPAEAIATFREVLAIAARHDGEVRVDPLQRLHTLDNLAELLRKPPAGVPRTLRDESLQREAGDIRAAYLAEPTAKLAASNAELDEAASAPHGLPEDRSGGWWAAATELLERETPNAGAGIASYIRDTLSESDRYRYVSSQNATSLARRFRDLAGLRFVLARELGGLSDAQSAALAEVAALRADCERPAQGFIEQAAHCGTCRGLGMGIAGRHCRHCHLDDLITAWELRLFQLTAVGRAGGSISAEEAVKRAQAFQRQRVVGRGGLNEEGVNEGGIRAGQRRADTAVGTSEVVHKPSDAEVALRCLATRLRGLRGLDRATAEERDRLLATAKGHFERLEADKRLCWRARALGTVQRAFLYAHDELGMAAMRLQVRAPGERVSEEEERYRLLPAQLPVRNAELSAERAVGDADLARKLGTLRYLKGLKASRQRALAEAEPDAAAPPPFVYTRDGEAEVCPVCQDALPAELAVLPCGHPLCHACCIRLVDRGAALRGSARLTCPTCRSPFTASEIAHVDGRPPKVDDAAAEDAADEAAIPVSGSYGTKLEAVVRRLLFLTQQDPTAKVLVFSTWVDVLELVAHALRANKLPYAYARQAKQFNSELHRFKRGPSDDDDAGGHIQVLLMLIKQGANGLNLTEAQHVVLVEPLLDPAQEAQAVGRVDRIGQTRATTVHRFVVQASVEQNVHRLCSRRAAASSAAGIAGANAAKNDAAQLTVGDVASLLNTRWDEEPSKEAGVVDLPASQDGKAAPAPAAVVARCDPGPSPAT